MAERIAPSPMMLTAALLVAALGGAVATYVALDVSGAMAPATDAAPSPAAQAVARDPQSAGQIVALYEQVNDQFVEKLREYGTRAGTIADVADAEGAATSAEQLRELQAEVDDLIRRYELIRKDR